MKILLIHNQYQERGGEDVAVEQEISILTERGHQVELLTFENSSLSGFAKKLKTGIASIYNRQSAHRLVSILERFRPEVIHVHNLFFQASPAILIIAAKLRIPVVLTLHNYRLICSNALLLRDNSPCELCIHQTFPIHGIRHKCYRNSSIESALVTAITGIHKVLHTWQNKVDYYICLSEFNKRIFSSSSLKVPESQLLIKPNFIPDPGTGDWPRQLFFLFVGRLSLEKGANIMLQAFSELPQYSLVVLGDGPEKEHYQTQFGHYPNIDFKGQLPRNEVLKLLKQCQALVFPSIWYEGLPFTILEAFATGTPVIASKLGAMETMIHHEVNGVHFEPGHVNDLKTKITWFSESPADSRERLSQNARRTYLENYHPDVHYHSILSIYQKAISNRKH